MGQTLTSFSQLSKSLVERQVEVASPRVEQQSAPAVKPAEDDESMRYFSHRESPDMKSSPVETVETVGDAHEDELAAMKSALEEVAAEKVALEAELAEQRERQNKLEKAHAEDLRELERLRGECARLTGEARKAAEKAATCAPAAEAATMPVVDRKPADALVEASGAIEEMFEGEVREQVLAALAEALDAARRSGRDRRAALLEKVLAKNTSTGELERRRAEIKQIFKDAGAFNDSRTLAALERLGIKCISGRTHWKLQYADIRMPLSKTPSDYRANLNTAADMGNRCF